MPGVANARSAPHHFSCLWTVLQVSLVSDHVSALPTFLNVASSQSLAVESVLPVFGLSAGLFTLMWVLSRCTRVVNFECSYFTISPRSQTHNF